ncbi:hypothetical protein H7X65_02475 [Candidatus Parcubacteria bacterium]|nr:hypothetical protein [Candidatus Parcubacteria bacterium]
MKEFENPPVSESSEHISPAIAEYLKERSIEAKVIQVPLFEGVRIETGPHEQEQVLITEKLNGCTATIIWTEQADHTRSAQLVHFPPFMLARHLEKISSLVTQDDIDAPKKNALIYLQSKRKENEDEISTYIKSLLGEQASVTVEYYDTGEESDIAGIEMGSEKVIYHLGQKNIAAN